MGKLSVFIDKIKEFLKSEPILDKKGRPMTKEQVKAELTYLIYYFQLDFFKDRKSEDLMVEYEPDFRRLHAVPTFIRLQYEYLLSVLAWIDRFIKNYPAEQCLTEEQKKVMSEKRIKRHDKMIVDNLSLNMQRYDKVKIMIKDLKAQAKVMGVKLPKQEKRDKIDKILDEAIAEAEAENALEYDC